MSDNPAKIIHVHSPADLLTVIPGLLGFTPENSLVIVGVEGPRNHVKVTLRYDLPGPADTEIAQQIIAHMTFVLTRAAVHTAIVVIYGPADVGDLLNTVLTSQDQVKMSDILRVNNNRYWSYRCDNPDCCPPEGATFDTDYSVPAHRDDLTERVAPVAGGERDVMRQATRHAEAARQSTAAKLDTVQSMLRLYRDGDPAAASLDDFAELSVALASLRIRDDAWSRMDPAQSTAHIALWTDVTRRAQPGYVAAPASLLAFVAWQSGNGALANVALDRALADDPHYSMALLLQQVINAGAPPSLARLPMTPEEVAASYGNPEDDPDTYQCTEGHAVVIGEQTAHETWCPGRPTEDDEQEA